MKKFYLLVFSLIVFLCFSLRVVAYGPDFDPDYYAKKYPDVVAVFGNDPELLYNHYKVYGIREGRYQNAKEETVGVTNTSGLNPWLIDPSVEVIPGCGYTTYIDVNITTQMVTYFEDGEIKFQSYCVTGNERANHSTPKGKYAIIVKKPGKRLKGPTWDCWVNRWMRFTDTAVGFHDATWRRAFGGEIYKTNGSHGCVNLPKDAAYQLYDLVEVGTTVIVHD
jgi:lipoprotein-anchoring transpeptidase ErfK/SrfK